MKRIIALVIAATVLCFLFSACSSSQQAKETEAITEPPTEEETIAEFHTKLSWEIVSSQIYYRDNDEGIAWRIYVSGGKSASNYDIRDLYMELLQTQDPSDLYAYHMAWIYFDRSGADGTGIADIAIEQIVSGSHDAEATGSLGRFIITHRGVCSPAVKN